MRHLLLVSCLLSLAGLFARAEEAGGWVVLVGEDAGDVWKGDKLQKWTAADAVALDPKNEKRLSATPGKTALANGKDGRAPDLITKRSFGDLELEMEFVIAKGSNSGVKFHGLYEIQILDSFGKKDADLTGDDCGGIYPKATLTPKYKHLDKGTAPKKNASKKAGEWQKLTAVFLAPRFDQDGKKTANARIVRATLNGETIHEDVELLTPTGHNHVRPELAKGPLLLQGDHGPVAFRAVRVRELRPK